MPQGAGAVSVDVVGVVRGVAYQAVAMAWHVSWKGMVRRMSPGSVALW
jgi:hypothetical protein